MFKQGSRKRFSAVILILVFAVQLFSFHSFVVATANFSDLQQDHFAYSAIMEFLQKGFVQGYNENGLSLFKPNNFITRAEACTIACNMQDLKVVSGKTKDFSDVEADSWYKKAIDTAVSNNLASGYPDGTFKPKAQITRAEIASIISKAVGNINISVQNKFSDISGNPWYLRAVMVCFQLGIISGYPDGSFRPEANATRAESVVMLSKLYSYLKKSQVSVLSPTPKITPSVNGVIATTIPSPITVNPQSSFPTILQPESSIPSANGGSGQTSGSAGSSGGSGSGSGGGSQSSGGSGSSGGNGSGQPTDTQNRVPEIFILTPSTESSFTVIDKNFRITGEVRNPQRVTSVKYEVYNGKTGIADGIQNFSFGDLGLVQGENTITISAIGSGNEKLATRSLKVTYKVAFVKPISVANVVYDPQTNVRVVKNQLLVSFKEGVTYDSVQQIVYNSSYSKGGVILGCIPITNDYQIEYADQTLDEIKIIKNQLKTNSDVDSVMLNYVYGENELAQLVPNDTSWNNPWDENVPEGSNWGLEAIKAPSAWDAIYTPHNIKIGIMDVGFDISHQDLTFSATQCTSNNVTMNVNDHGTHVAGIIGATANNSLGTTGFVWNKQMYGFVGNTNVSEEQFKMSQIFDYKYGLAWLIENGCKVINISLGVNHRLNYNRIPDDNNETDVETFINAPRQYWTPFIKKLMNKNYNFVLVQAAGNDGIDAKWNTFLASINDVDVNKRIMIVGALKNKGSFLGRHNGYSFDAPNSESDYTWGKYSNYGTRVDILAPGTDIYSTMIGNKYGYLSGTSMAAPHVTAVASKVWDINPNLSPEQVKSIVMNTSDRPVSFKDRQYTILNAYEASTKALQSIASGVVPPVAPIQNGILIGTVKNAVTRAPIDDVQVSIYNSGTTYTASTSSTIDGSYEAMVAINTEPYTVIFTKSGYYGVRKTVLVQNAIELFNADMWLIPDTVTGNGTATGTISNALNNEVIPNATLKFREGVDMYTGETLQVTATTNASGNYTVDLPSGSYTAEITANGFIKGYITVLVIGLVTTPSQNASITPVMAAEETRIVLTWGQTPADLDAHLSGPTTEGTRFHVYFSNKTYSVASSVYDELDIDDTTSYGPETTTIHKQIGGVYRFSVHDYTNKDYTSGNALAVSGASVKVYRGNVLVATYNVPTDRAGTLWTVFEIDGNTITPVNTMEFESIPTNR